MIDLEKIKFTKCSMHELYKLAMSKDSPSSFHFIAVSTLVSPNLDALTFQNIQKNHAICDSRYLSITSRLFGDKVQQIRGTDFFVWFLKNSESTIRHLVLGSTDETLKKLVKKVQTQFSNVKHFECHTLPILSFQAQEDFDCLDVFFNSENYDIAWIALGSPKQDKVAIYITQKFGISTIALGAAIDFVAGAKKESPKIIRVIGLEWCFRLMLEPSRLWKRYLVGNPVFLIAVFRIIIRRSLKKMIGHHAS